MVSSIGGSSSQPITFGGLVSGINTSQIIAQLINAQKAPITQLQTQITTEQQQSTAIGDINTRLQSLLSAAQSFTNPTYLQGKTSTVTPGGTSPTVAVNTDGTASVGSFKVQVQSLATATYVASPNAVGAVVDPTQLLQSEKLGTPVTAGSFSINGVSFSLDPTVDSLNAVISRINASTDPRMSGVRASIVNDSNGRANLLQITGSSPVTLGSGADTSNFLTVTKLISSPGTTTRTSTGALGVVQTGALLGSANFATPITTPSGSTIGSFTINGVTLNYDTSQDSLSTVLTKINTSTAGVTASYDPASDKVTLVNKTTGSTQIQLQDGAGSNLLAAIGVGSTTQTLGKNAQYTIDNGSGPITYYSTTNTVANALPGVSLTLLNTGTAADTVQINQDTAGAVSKMNAFVAQVNSTLSFLQQQTAINPPATPGAAPINGPLSGDASITGIYDTIRKLLTSPIQGVSGGYTSFADLGLSFGAVGSAVNSTNTLVLDQNKFQAALQANPAQVANVFSAFSATASLNSGGTGGVQSLTGSPSSLRVPGTYAITTAVNRNGTANITAVFTPSDGGSTITTTANNLVAGSSNQTLIPGLKLQLKSSFTAGTDKLTIATPTLGIEAELEQYINPLTRANGILTQRQSSVASDIKNMNSQITDMNTRLTQQQTYLVNKFTAMEVALQQLKVQQSTLTSMGLTGQSTFG